MPANLIFNTISNTRLISSIYTVYESVYNNYLFDNMSVFYGNIKFNIVGSVILLLTAICCLSKLKI